MGEMNVDAVEVVCPEGAALAAGLPVGAEHEVIDHQLRASSEQVCQRFPSVGSLEDVILRDALPWQAAPFRTQLVTQTRELLFLGKKLFAGFYPRVVRHDRMTVAHRAFSFLRCLRGRPSSISRIEAASKSNCC